MSSASDGPLDNPLTDHPGPGKLDTSFFGHPRGLSTLFFTEMWERFSYYGMRAILILFMTAPIAAGGLAFPTEKAGIIYGTYTSLVYLTALPGGWLADKLFGQRRAVFGVVSSSCAGTSAWRFPISRVSTSDLCSW